MEWSKLFASLPDNPRVQAAESDGAGGWLLLESFCYCTSAESGGFIPKTQVPRFGGQRLRQRVASLVRERLWIEVDGGYLLDPEIWNEDRNLSDSAEKKRQADRERIAAKRAAEKAGRNGNVSRDNRATDRATQDATSRRDSRSVDQIRSDPSVVNAINHLSRRYAPAREDDDLLKIVIDSIHQRTRRVIDADQAALVADEILSGQQVSNPCAYAQKAILREPNPAARWLAEWSPAESSWPEWCGKCDEKSRLSNEDNPRRCPDCHPLTQQEAS